MQAWIRFLSLSATTLPGLLLGCSQEPPVTRELVCARPPAGGDGGEKMIFLLDTGRHRVDRADGPRSRSMALTADGFAYRFGDAAGSRVVISRYDGAMTLHRAGGKGARANSTRWSCISRKPGPLV